MKHLYTLLVIALVVTGFSSCKKDSDPYDKGNLVGTWILKKQELKRYRYDVEYVNETRTTFPNNNMFKFNADGTGSITTDTESYDFLYNYLRDAFTITRKNPNGVDIILVTPYKVVKSTSSELVIRYDQTYLGKDDRATYRDVSDEYYTK